MSTAALTSARDAVDHMRIQISVLEERLETSSSVPLAHEIACSRLKLAMLETTVTDVMSAIAWSRSRLQRRNRN